MIEMQNEITNKAVKFYNRPRQKNEGVMWTECEGFSQGK